MEQRLTHCLAASVTFTATGAVGKCCLVAGIGVRRCAMRALVGAAPWRVLGSVLVARLAASTTYPFCFSYILLVSYACAKGVHSLLKTDSPAVCKGQALVAQIVGAAVTIDSML